VAQRARSHTPVSLSASAMVYPSSAHRANDRLYVTRSTPTLVPCVVAISVLVSASTAAASCAAAGSEAQGPTHVGGAATSSNIQRTCQLSVT